MSLASESLHSEIVFTLDENDMIVSVSGNWDEFAMENGGEEILAADVLNTNIYDHVDGDITRMFIESILQAARMSVTTKTREYRCDSPVERRWMTMMIRHDGKGRLELTHNILRTEPNTSNVKFKVDPSGKHSMTKRCSMCNKIQVNSEWQEVDTAVAAEALSDGTTQLVIYGVCAACLEKRYD